MNVIDFANNFVNTLGESRSARYDFRMGVLKGCQDAAFGMVDLDDEGSSIYANGYKCGFSRYLDHLMATDQIPVEEFSTLRSDLFWCTDDSYGDIDEFHRVDRDFLR
jgi:hypothetical protein